MIKRLSKENVKWPRYQVEVGKGLAFKDAKRRMFDMLTEHLNWRGKGTMISSQYSYNAVTGVFDTRIGLFPGHRLQDGAKPH